MLRLAASRGGGPRNALGHRPVPLPAETSREAPKCCAWQHREVKPETRSGTVQSLKCCPCQQKRAAKLQSAAPGSIEGHRPEPEVLPLPAETSREAPKCCAWQHRGAGPRKRDRGAGPRNALGHRPEPEVLPLPAETSQSAAPGSIQGGGARNALGHRPEPECCPCQQKRAAKLKVLRLAASRGGAPKRARAPSRA